VSDFFKDDVLLTDIDFGADFFGGYMGGCTLVVIVAGVSSSVIAEITSSLVLIFSCCTIPLVSLCDVDFQTLLLRG